MGLLRLFAPETTFDPKNPDDYFRTDHIRADITGRTVRGGAVVIASQLLQQSVSIGSVIILARLLTPSETGLVAMVSILTGFLETIDDLGLSAATVQRAEINQNQVSTLFWINIGFSLLLSLVTAASAPVIAWFYGEPRLIPITLVLSSAFFLVGLTFQHRALLRRQMNFTSLAVVSILSTIVSVIAGIGSALSGFSYWSLVIMKLASAPIAIIALWRLCSWRPSRPMRGSGVRSMVSFGSNLAGFRLLIYFGGNLDNILIGRFFGPAQLGLYIKAYGLMLMPHRRINQPIAGVAWPALSRLTDAPDRYRQAYTRIVAKVCLVTMPLTAFMVGTADWLIVFLLGPQWIEAVQMFVWLGIVGLIEPFLGTSMWLFLSQGRAHQQFRWAIVSAVITVTSILIGLPWGPVGVAAAYGIFGLLLRAPLLLWYVGRTGPVSTRHLYSILAPFACVSCSVLLSLFVFRLWAAGPNPLINLVAGAGITAVVSLAVLAGLPSGRAALQDLKSLPSLLGMGKSSA